MCIDAVDNLQGYFNVQIQNCVITKGRVFDTIWLSIWGLPRKDVPQLNTPKEGDSCTVVCPVVTEWSLFQDYLQQAESILVELKQRYIVWRAACTFSFPIAECRDDAAWQTVKILDEFRDEQGTIDMMVWVDATTPKMLLDRNKRRRLITARQPEVVVKCIADVFDLLEKNMTKWDSGCIRRVVD